LSSGTDVSNPADIMICNTLASMPTPVATSALVTWLASASDAVASAIPGYVMQSTTDATLRVWEGALSANVQFNSEANRNAIRLGLSAYHSSRRQTL
jgi:hypothetical protein